MTSQPVTVDADDLHALITAFAMADQSFRPFLGCLPGHAEACQAACRLASVLTATGSALPPDPVSDADASAISTSEMMESYRRHGFRRDEAFSLTLAWVEAMADAGIRQAMRGGA